MNSKKFLVFVLLIAIGFTACNNEEEQNDVITTDSSQINIQKFTASVYKNMDKPLGVAELRLDQILGDAGLLDGSAKQQAPMLGLADMYINSMKEALALDERAYLILDDVDMQKGQLSQGLAVIKIKDAGKFEEFMNGQGEIEQKDDFSYLNLNKAHCAWKDGIAMVAFSNTGDASEYLMTMMKNGLKLEEDKRLDGNLVHEDDIHLYFSGKEILASVQEQNKNKINSEAQKFVDAINEDIDDSNVDVALNFEKGKLLATANNNISEKLLPLLDVLKSDGLNADVMNNINATNSIGFLSLNIDVAKFSANVVEYIKERKLLDASITGQSKMIENAINGQIAMSMIQDGTQPPKPLIFIGAKDAMLSAMLAFTPLKSNEYSVENNNLVLFPKVENWTKNSESFAYGEYFSANPLACKFDLSKIDDKDMRSEQKMLLSLYSDLEFSGNFNKVTGSLTGTNQEENILKTSLLAIINHAMNKNKNRGAAIQ